MKHIIAHFHCLDHPAVHNLLMYLVEFDSIFTGQKIATVTKNSREPVIHELVSKILTNIGYDVTTVTNDVDLREVGPFFDISLPLLLSRTSEGLLFYCHTKGVSYHPESEDGKNTELWTRVLLEYCLGCHAEFPFDDIAFDTFGTCIVRDQGFLPDNLNESFSYVGTMFWIRLNKLAGKTFKPTSKFYLEALPGLITELPRAYNIGPTIPPKDSPYLIKTWRTQGIDYDFQRKN